MSIIFGPVPSRRYGLSLGVDIIPRKTCSLNCIFCEVGKTDNLSIERRPFVRLEELKKELDEFFKKDVKLDVITFSGSGEPTLNTEIGRMIRYIKKRYTIPIVVLTNGTLLWMKEVREELSFADIVEPTLFSVDEETFIKIARPDKNIIFPLYIEGLIRFRREFKGNLFLEIFFVKNINDDEKKVLKWKELINRINPKIVHLNTIDRPPPLNLEPVSYEFLLNFKNKIGESVIILSRFKGKSVHINIEDLIKKTISVRPLKIEDIYFMINEEKEEIDSVIQDLKEKGIIREVIYNGERYIQGI